MATAGPWLQRVKRMTKHSGLGESTWDSEV